MTQLDEFTQAYIDCAFWSSTVEIAGECCNLDEIKDIEDLAPETLGAMIADCERFQKQYSALLKSAYMSGVYIQGAPYSPSNAGHDFWLTRCGHGAGFWDRGLGTIGEALAKTCGFKTQFDNVDLYIGDDGLIYC